MSRERKLRRDERQRSETFNRMLELRAKAEGKSIESPEARTRYIEELKERGYLIDMGPHSSGVGRRMSFRVSNEEAPEFSSLAEMFEALFGRRLGQ